MTQLTYTNIFEAITDDKSEAADLQFRADMMLAMRDLFRAKGWNQAQIGNALGISQPRVSELVRGKVDKVSSDKLIGYLAKLGFRLKPTYQPSRGKKSPIQCQVRKEAA